MNLSMLVHEAEEGGYWAEVPSMPGCATQGETLDELKANMLEAIEGYAPATTRWSEQDEAFIAEIPELPGCMADGETREEALRNLEEVQAIWIKTAVRLGRPIP